MRYLLLVLCLAVVGVLVGVGMYTTTGQGILIRLFGVQDAPVILSESAVKFVNDSVYVVDALPSDVPAGAEIDAVSFIPDSFSFTVDAIEEREGGYVAFITRLNGSVQYEMPVFARDLGDAYVTLMIGDVVQVEVNSILERDLPAPSILYPITIVVEEALEE